MTHGAVCALEAGRRWAVTATPLQNRLLDLASLLTFLRMDPYDTPKAFQALTNRLVNDFQQEGAKSRLRQMVRCVMLRRSQTTVELPPRTDRVVYLDFSAQEAELYRELKQQALGGYPADTGAGSVGFSTLQLFTMLRMVCNLGSLYRRSIDQRPEDAFTTWNERTAQELFRTCVASGVSSCHHCLTDVSEAASKGTDGPERHALSRFIRSCGHLFCNICSANHATCSCIASVQYPIHFSPFSSATPGENPVAEQVDVLPTKIMALLKDLEAHVVVEKWLVTLL